MPRIEGSLSREKLRDLRSLDSVKIRKRKGLCVVEGERSIAESARTGNLLYLVVSDDRTLEGIPLANEPLFSQVPCYTLAHSQFREVTGIRAGIGLLGVAQMPVEADPGDLRNAIGKSLLFFFDGIQEPGNVGALIRTAWALGANGVLLGEGTADPFSHKGVRASAGGVFHLPVYSGCGEPEMEVLTSSGYDVFLAQKDGKDYRSIDYPERMILALGNEGAGLSKWVARSGTAVGIPLAEEVDSLNVVVAGGIIASRMME